MNYRFRADRSSLQIRRVNGTLESVSSELIHQAIPEFDRLLDKFDDFGVDVFSLLGMRNLSAFLGELLGSVIIKQSGGIFKKNPHQDGYPDLLLMDHAGTALWKELTGRLREKTPFSPFATGGIEIKATCGSVPTSAQLQKRGLEKPDLGDERISLMRGYDWKAHHRDTNNLLGIIWDFVGNRPRIVACFYSNRLGISDWGEIIQPKKGGGKTTSVSIMTRPGVRKMYEDWLLVADDPRYASFIDSYNKGSLLAASLSANS